MQIRKAIAVAVLLVLVALTGASAALAQGGTEGWGGSGGSTCLQAASNTDGMSPTAGLDLNLLAQLRAGVFSTFSWGRGTMGRPGSLRSSTAVLRERRGLMLR